VNFRPFVTAIFPCLAGLNATETVQLPLAAIEPPQVSPVCTNGAETPMPVIVIAVVVDLLVSVTVCGSLTRPTTTFPKPIALGERSSLGASALCVSSADCANTGRANAVSTNNSEKVRAAIVRGKALERANSAPGWRTGSPLWQRSGRCAHHEPTITKVLCSVSVREMSTHRGSKHAKQHHAEAGSASEKVSPECLIRASPSGCEGSPIWETLAFLDPIRCEPIP